MTVRARKKNEVGKLEEAIDNVRSYIDNVDHMKSLSADERHQLCNQVMELQNDYRKLTGRYYRPNV